MSRALDELRREHEVVLATIERAEHALACGEDIDVPALLAFLHAYVEEKHHAKEERALFPLLRDDPTLRDVVDTLTGEHDEGRQMLRQLQASLAGGGATIAAQIRAYAGYIRGHILKEDTMIFEAAENALDSSAAGLLAEEFARIEEDSRA